MLACARLRRNRELTIMAWQTSVLSMIHVGRKDRSKLSPRRLLFTMPGFDPDPDEVLAPRKNADEDDE